MAARDHHGERRAVRTGLAVSTVLCIAEAVGGWWTNSLALLSDAAHMVGDVAALSLTLFALWVKTRPASSSKTFGYYRAEILAALVNAIVLLGIAAGILVETYQRLLKPPAILGGPMLAVASAGLAVNLVCAWLLHAGAEESLNVRAAYLDVLGDALSSVGVVVAAAIVILTGWTLADALASGAIALVIVPRTWRLLRQAVNVLLEGTPAHLNLGEIEEAMRRVPGVRRVHDLHVWTLTSGREAMSAHAVVDDVRDSERLLETLHAVMHARFGIDHTTIQLEMEPPAVLRIQGPGSAQAAGSS
jgi:cobalt-zinc-cadmium efflux system protein